VWAASAHTVDFSLYMWVPLVRQAGIDSVIFCCVLIAINSHKSKKGTSEFCLSLLNLGGSRRGGNQPRDKEKNEEDITLKS